jgi:hypothetical protein
MRPVTSREIRDRMRVARMRADTLPDLTCVEWPEIEYLVWDARRGTIAYLAIELDDQLHVIALQRPGGAVSTRVEMCTLCVTLHPAGGVGMWTFQARDARGRYYALGIRACARLECGDYVRGRLAPPLVTIGETLSMVDRRLRLRRNVTQFVRRALDMRMEGRRAS